MSFDENVSTHYTHGNLLRAVRTGIEQLGKTQNSITIEDLAPVDEFHIGGRQASVEFLDQLNFSSEDHVILKRHLQKSYTKYFLMLAVMIQDMALQKLCLKFVERKVRLLCITKRLRKEELKSYLIYSLIS